MKKEGLGLLNEWGFLKMEQASEDSSTKETLMLKDDYFK